MRRAFIMSVLILGVLLIPTHVLPQNCFGLVTIRPTSLLKKPKESASVIAALPTYLTLVFWHDTLLNPIGKTCEPTEKDSYYHVIAWIPGKPRPALIAGDRGWIGWVPKADVELVPCDSTLEQLVDDLYSVPSQASLLAGAKKVLADRQSSKLISDYAFEISSPSVTRQPVLERPDYSIKYTMAGNAIGIKLTNRSNVPIRVDWSQSAIVSVSGQSLAIIHQGVKFADRDKPMVPTMVPPGAFIQDILAPSSSVTFTDAGWVSAPMFGIGQDPLNQELGVMLALQVGDKTTYETVRLKVIRADSPPTGK